MTHQNLAIDTDCRTADRLLAEIRNIAPAIAARAAEIERARRIPPDLVRELKSLGVFRLFVPRSRGGFELDLPDGLEIIAALSRIDGSVGWTVAIASVGSLFATLLPRETYDGIYASGRDVVIAGSSQPAGKAEATADGWRVSGRWPFASGCRHADWIAGMCSMVDPGEQPAGEDAQLRFAFLPAGEWQIGDTWYAAGLKGTGSDHVALMDKAVPSANFLDPATGVPCVAGPLYKAAPHFVPLIHGAVAVGIAEGAMDDLLAVAGSGRQQQQAAVPLARSETFQYELGRLIAELRAARAFLAEQTASHWRHALSGTLRDEALLAQGTLAGTWVTTACVGVAAVSFTLAGGNAVFDSSPLQRRLRDIHVAAQHAAVHQRHYVAGGRIATEQFRDCPDDVRRFIA